MVVGITRARTPWLVGIAVTLAIACQDPKASPAPADAAPSSAVTTPAPSASIAAPDATPTAPSASASAKAPRCADAGAAKDAAVTFVYTQVFVPTPGQRSGTTFSVAFGGRGLALPSASEIYPSCSVVTTNDPNHFELTCEKRKDPVCTIALEDERVLLECSGRHHELPVPCGVRATLKPGRIPGRVSYN